MNRLSLIQIINLLYCHQCLEKRSKNKYPEATPENIAQAEAFARQIVEHQGLSCERSRQNFQA